MNIINKLRDRVSRLRRNFIKRKTKPIQVRLDVDEPINFRPAIRSRRSKLTADEESAEVRKFVLEKIRDRIASKGG